MRYALLSWSLCLLAATAVPTAAQADKPRPPKKGDAIVIKGCLRGSAVEAAQLLSVDVEGVAREAVGVPVLTYRLKGEKKQLKGLEDKHDRKIVEVKGILRSELSGSGIGGTVGRTRITIGVDPRAGRSPHGQDRAIPVLEVTSFDGTAVSCAR
jgi:hypothetical protein